MGYSNLILRVVALISFLMALEAAAVGPAAAMLLVLSGVVGWAGCAGLPSLDTALQSRAAMAPWLLSAAAVLMFRNSTIAVVLSVVGAVLVGASVTQWRAYNRMVPALGLPMIVSIIASGADVGLSVVPWIVVVADFALLTNHMEFEATPRSLNRAQGGLVHQPFRAVQAVTLIGVCVGLSMLLAPMIRTPEVDIGLAAFGGNLGGPQLSAHPGLKYGQLDTGRRVELGEEIVLRVKADRPDYWRGITYTSWDGQVWTNPDRGVRYTWPSEGVTLSAGQAGGQLSQQQFTVERAGLDVIHGAYKIEALWSTQRAGQVGDDGSVTLDEPLGAGAKWTVRSSVRTVTPEILRNADPLTLGISKGMANQYAKEADITPRVEALALEITQDQPTTYDKVKALESWMDDNIKYSRNIAGLPDGADAVEQLLFIDQLGYCEQIGTALVVMLRSLNIPARLVVGYVPGSYDESSGEWISRASDAHAWAEVFFPGVGWQGFDPTSGVPLSGDALTTQSESSGGPDLIVTFQVLAAMVALFGIGALASHLLERHRNGPHTRIHKVDVLGSRLQRDWTPSMTIREKLNDLSQLGVDGELTERVTVGLEHISYNDVPGGGHLNLDSEIKELQAAVDQLVKVPT